MLSRNVPACRERSRTSVCQTIINVRKDKESRGGVGKDGDGGDSGLHSVTLGQILVSLGPRISCVECAKKAISSVFSHSYIVGS